MTSRPTTHTQHRRSTCCVVSYCHRGMFHSQEIIDYIEGKLRATWSPEQIACTPCELKMPSWRTIYRWIYEKYLVNGNLKVLRRKGKSHGVKETRGKYSKGKSIRKRDKSMYSRQEAGHWEADTVVSGQGKSKACFATLAERKTRFYIAVKMPDRPSRDYGERYCRCTICVSSSTRRQFQALCKPPSWCRIEAEHRRFLHMARRNRTPRRKCPPGENPGVAADGQHRQHGRHPKSVQRNHRRIYGKRLGSRAG